MIKRPASPLHGQTKRVLAFLDVLGWAELTSSSKPNSVEATIVAQAHVEATAASRKSFKELLASWGTPMEEVVRWSYFSDTFIYSCAPTTGETSLMVASVQQFIRGLLERGLYVRGAITVGNLRHDDGAVVGPALVEAARIEKEVAIYPRLVVTERAEPFVVQDSLFRREAKGRSLALRDADGLLYLDLFRWFDRKKRGFTEHAEARALREKVAADVERIRPKARGGNAAGVSAQKHKAKYCWMLSYLDRVLADPVTERN